jgi:hypothetical protein
MTLRPITAEHPPCYCYGLWEVTNKNNGVYSHHMMFIARFIKVSEMFGKSKCLTDRQTDISYMPTYTDSKMTS